ncbi:MAG: hypothetical protein AAFX08_08630 [Pseudomonadota bacterium]
MIRGGQTPARAAAPTTTANNDRLDPQCATARVKEWRRELEKALGAAPSADLEEPRRVLAMLNALGRTRRTAEAAMRRPTVAAEALLGGADDVLDAAFADLEGLRDGVGAGHTLNGALSSIRGRMDVGLDIAELVGDISASEACESRAWFADRIVEAALSWLVRAAVGRGELALGPTGDAMEGVFALASGDLATRDLIGGAPIEAIVVYTGDRFTDRAASAAERAFVRIGAELKEVLSGAPGEPCVFALKTPLGDGVNGQGVVETDARLASTIANPQMGELADWMAGARLIAGDADAGGAVLERLDDVIWNATPLEFDDNPVEDADPAAAFVRIASALRRLHGAARPCFRAPRTAEAIRIAGESGLMARHAAERLSAGARFALTVASRAGMIGDGAFDRDRDSLAALCGFSSTDKFDLALYGAMADAEDAFERLAAGPHAAFAPFRPSNNDGPSRDSTQSDASADASADARPDATTLEALGFKDGEAISLQIDDWAARWTDADGAAPRFAAIAPGLLTAFGETKSPDAAARLFDATLRATTVDQETLAASLRDSSVQEGLAHALGDFGPTAAPLTETAAGAAFLLQTDDIDHPVDADELLMRFGPDGVDSQKQLAAWRRLTIARVSGLAAFGILNMDAAADALRQIQDRTLTSLFASCTAEAGANDACLLRLASRFDGAPDAKSALVFAAPEASLSAAETAARAFLEQAGGLCDGPFALNVSADKRPGGDAAPLVASFDRIKAFLNEEAIATDRLAYARAVVLVGDDAAIGDALKGAANPNRRADAMMRDIDRIRTQRMRQAGDEHDSLSPYDQPDGGSADVELVISILIHRHVAANPELRSASVDEALDRLARADLIGHDVARALKAAHGFHVRLAAARGFAGWRDARRTAPRRRFGELLARSAGVGEACLIKPLAVGHAAHIRSLYGQLAQGRPAAGLSVEA